jgi:hypothetical protein
MPKSIEQFAFGSTYAKPEQGLRVLSVNDIPMPSDFVPQAAPLLIHIAPYGWGGNHRHRRRELWVGYGESLYLIWRDENGERQELKMTRSDGKLQALIVASQVPHMVENRSDSPALLYELRDIDDGPAAPLEGEESLRSK